MIANKWRTASALFVAIVLVLPGFAKAAPEPEFPCDPDGTTFMNVGDIVFCDIGPVGDSDLFEFSGTAGETILLTLTDLTGGGAAPILQLFDPMILEIDSFFAQDTGVERLILLDETGSYTILLTESGNNQTVSYKIALHRLFPAPPTARPLCYGCVEPDEINPIPDHDVFLFNGAAGDKITLTLTDLTGGGAAPNLRLFDPMGTLIDSFFAQDTGVIREYDLVETGTYTVLLIESGNNQIVSYNLALQCIFGACPPPPRPECEIEMSQMIYVDGETVTADVFRFANSSNEAVAVEIKVWFGVPNVPPIEVINAGADGSVVFPPGFDVDLGPTPLFLVTQGMSRGTYEFSCRILDPVTGRARTVDLNPFEIQDP